MFGWRKKKDGFEWHQYVRTTIKLRRDARREKAEHLKQQAADGVKAAGAVAGDAARVGARKLGEGSRVAAGAAGGALGGMARLGGGLLGRIARLIGAWLGGFVGGVRSLRRRFQLLSPRGRLGAAAVGGLAAIALTSAVSGHLGFSVQRFANLPTASLAPTKTVEGRATATGPDTLRVGQTVVRLGDIEAPEKDQRCLRSGKRWRCGEAAAAALAKLANGRTLKCDVRGAEAAGIALGICRDGTTEINGQLVKGGHVFARSGLMARYGTLEGEAKAAKAGLWSGEAERPSVYRARLWDEAKKKAPDGCPIKASAQGSSRAYVMPWAPDYERVRVNSARGGRWFCSEQDAVAAGWTARGP